MLSFHAVSLSALAATGPMLGAAPVAGPAGRVRPAMRPLGASRPTLSREVRQGAFIPAKTRYSLDLGKFLLYAASFAGPQLEEFLGPMRHNPSVYIPWQRKVTAYCNILNGDAGVYRLLIKEVRD